MARVLLINPTIHDFAAYDFWAKPLGLLFVGAALESVGVHVDLLDLTDPLSPHLAAGQRPARKPFGHGKFHREPAERPAALPAFERRYSRYGLPHATTRDLLARWPRPDAVLVTSMMTYWYPGVFEIIRLIKQRWKTVPVVLGGVYATLCEDHARQFSGADYVLPGPLSHSIGTVAKLLGRPDVSFSPQTMEPAHHLYARADSAALLTSLGCPLRCRYCGVHALQPTYVPLAPKRVEQQVRRIVLDLKIRNIALFDDAFLYDTKRARMIMDSIAAIGQPVRIHAASGLSCAQITGKTARAMKRAGFATVRLGLETADPKSQAQWGNKVSTAQFRRAAKNLIAVGFSPRSVGVYILMGLPGQRLQEVEQTLDEVLDAGLRPHLAYYAPIPKSPLFDKAQAASRFDLSEPLFHNPTLLSCAGEEFSPQAIQRVKRRVLQAQRALSPLE